MADRATAADRVSDQGSDLVKGIRGYADSRPEVAHVADAAHVGANLLKASWESQPAWSIFVGKLQDTATTLRQSSCAALTAPRPRPKGRFMNLEVQPRFVRMLSTRLDGPAPDPRVVTYYGWLREYRAAVTEWLAEHELVRRTIRHLRRHGLHRGTQRELNGVWKELGIGGRAGLRSLARSWCGYVKRYRLRADARRRDEAAGSSSLSSFNRATWSSASSRHSSSVGSRRNDAARHSRGRGPRRGRRG